MKRYFNTSHVIWSLLLLLVCQSCNQPTTKADVEKDLGKANKAIEKAAEATDDAMTSKKEYYKDHMEEAIALLTERSTQVEKRIQELTVTARKSANKEAALNIQAAITAFRKEKSSLDRKIEGVKNQEQDWSASYDDIFTSITTIEAELDKLSKSIEKN
jgi:chromosome segregation ATPase